MRVLSFLAILMTALAVPATAQNPAGNAYTLEMEISEGGRTVGKPSISVREGARAIMTSSRAGGYSISVNLNRDTSNPDRVVVAADLYFERGGRWERVGSPRITAPVGQRTSMAASLPSGASAYRLSLLVRPAAVSASAQGKRPCDSAEVAAWEAAMKMPFDGSQTLPGRRRASGPPPRLTP